MWIPSTDQELGSPVGVFVGFFVSFDPHEDRFYKRVSVHC